MTGTEPRWLSAAEQTFWRAYLDMNAKLTARLNRELAEQAGVSLADFAVLAELSEHVDGRMRVLELARQLGWEKSRLSHQLSRMQQRGLIRRDTCAEDRRGAVIALDDEGRTTIAAAAPQHVASVRRYLFDVLGADDVAALGAIASAVVGRLDADCGSSGDDTCGSIPAGTVREPSDDPACDTGDAACGGSVPADPRR